MLTEFFLMFSEEEVNMGSYSRLMNVVVTNTVQSVATATVLHYQ
jgi:hypothetical protein